MSASSLLSSIGDVQQLVPFHENGQHHLLLRRAGELIHATSQNLLHWRFEEQAGTPPPGWSAGGACLVRQEGVYHLFYATQGGIGQATSRDLLTWEEPPKPVVLKTDLAVYRRDCCGTPSVFYHQPEKRWWLLFSSQLSHGPAARAGCIGLAKSTDLKRWQLAPPLWAPGFLSTCEAPQLLELTSRWYVLYRDRESQYRVANSATGPFRRPPLPQLYSNQVTSGTRATWDGRHWTTFPLVGGSGASGLPAIPRQLDFQLDGSITEHPARPFSEALAREPLRNHGLNQAQRLHGQWQPIEEHRFLRCTSATGGVLRLPGTSKDCYLRAEVVLEKPDSDLHLFIRSSQDIDRGYELQLSPREQRISLRNLLSSDPRPLASRWLPLPAGKPIELMLFMLGDLLEIFVAQRVSLSARLSGVGDGDLLVESRDGKARLGNLEVRHWPG